jgi:hypothetical protein
MAAARRNSKEEENAEKKEWTVAEAGLHGIDVEVRIARWWRKCMEVFVDRPSPFRDAVIHSPPASFRR